MTIHRTLLPEGWQRPKGYANGISASGRMIFTGGLIGWDAEERFAPGGLVGQFRQLLQNLIAVLREGDAGPEHLVRMTWYIASRDEYLANLAEIGGIYRELIGRNYPAMAVVEVSNLVEKEARIEIEAIAVVP
jgi:enamine deaminase RidA (YjgF/YER057c/UK114 family)